MRPMCGSPDGWPSQVCSWCPMAFPVFLRFVLVTQVIFFSPPASPGPMLWRVLFGQVCGRFFFSVFRVVLPAYAFPPRSWATHPMESWGIFSPDLRPPVDCWPPYSPSPLIYLCLAPPAPFFSDLNPSTPGFCLSPGSSLPFRVHSSLPS